LRPGVGFAAFVAAVLVVLSWAPDAAAYSWMIRHGYTGCSTCHSDPSGGTLLTEYGRAQSELLLSTQWSKEAAEEPSAASGQMLGLSLPDELLVGADVRDAYMFNFANGELVDQRFLHMRSDVMAQVTLSRVRLYGSLGYASEPSALNSEQAWVTRSASWGNLVSREHWIGVDIGDRFLLRGGRLNQPFGVRIVDHTMWVRSETQTDINQHQQHGLSLSYNANQLRAEGMAILGNYQVSPDQYRERGFAGYVELYPKSTWSVGASAKATHAQTDLLLRTATTRHAYGVMGRVQAADPLILIAEVDALLRNAPARAGSELGHASMLRADLEVVRGFHLVGTGETESLGDGAGTALGGWLTAWWFPIAHADLRLDFVSRTVPGGSASSQTVLLQGHVYL
jgi:hypothetical protein